MIEAPRTPGGCPLPPEVEAEKDEELTSKESDSIDIGDKGDGGATTGCAMYKRILSKGMSGSKNGLKIDTINEHWKNIYMQKCELAVKYKKSKAGL